MPNFEDILFRSIVWSTVSKAADKSKSNNTTQQLLSTALSMSFCTRTKAVYSCEIVYMQIEMAQIDYCSEGRL